MSEKNKEKLQFSISTYPAAVIGALLLISLVTGVVMAYKTSSALNDNIAAAKEKTRPADFDVVILEDATCQDCYDVRASLDAIKKQNVNVRSERSVDISDIEGQEFLKQLSVEKVPTLIISGEIEKHDEIKTLLSKVGTIQDSTFILTQTGAPYVETQTGTVRGRVTVTMVTDRTCEECYDVTQNEFILRRFGLIGPEVKIMDVNMENGKDLVQTYGITLIPTIVLAGDMDAYPALQLVWQQAGTVERDGIYVLREGVKQIGTYKDRRSGEIINPNENQEG